MSPHRTAMKLTFWGVRGSVPSPGPETMRYGGNTSCVEVVAGDERIVLDAGTGIRRLGHRLLDTAPDGDRVNRVSILISHTHWDHIQGLPFFVPCFSPKFAVTVYGCRQLDRKLESILVGQMDSAYFPVSFDDLSADIHFVELSGGQFNIGPVTISTIFLNHPGLTFGYRFEYDDRSIVYCSDNEPGRHVVLEAGGPVRNADSKVDGVDLDRRLTQFCRNADLLIYDSQYTAEEYTSHIGWGHSSIDDACQLAMEAEVKQYALFHHDPDHSDDIVDKKLEHCIGLLENADSNVECIGAREGDTLHI